jgi:hypothetical protein
MQKPTSIEQIASEMHMMKPPLPLRKESEDDNKENFSNNRMLL